MSSVDQTGLAAKQGSASAFEVKHERQATDDTAGQKTIHPEDPSFRSASAWKTPFAAPLSTPSNPAHRRMFFSERSCQDASGRRQQALLG